MRKEPVAAATRYGDDRRRCGAWIATLLWAACGPAFGQHLSVDRPIELVAPDATGRQVSGLPMSTAPDAVLVASVELTNAHRTVVPGGSTTWELEVDGIGSPSAGLHLLVHGFPHAEGPVSIMLNGAGPYALTHGTTDTVQAAELDTTGILSIVFDGTRFQLLDGRARPRRPCPEGMVAPSAQYCMDPETHPAGNRPLFEAMGTCASMGRRLCTWGEWVVGCLDRDALGITVSSSWEWTGDTANEDITVRVVRSTNPPCEGVGTGTLPDDVRRFRCCYTR